MGRRLFYVRQLKLLAAGLACLIAIVGLIGWLFGRSSLYAVRAQWPSMVPWTATLFVVLVIAFYLAPQSRDDDAKPSWREFAACCLAILVTLLAAIFMVSHGLGRDLGLDRLLFAESVANDPPMHPGRMSFTTALLFLITGIGLAASTIYGSMGRRAGELFGLASFLLSGLVLICYLYGPTDVQRIAMFGSISLLTAAAMLLCGVAVMSMSVHNRLMHLLLAEDGGGAILRRLVLPVLFVPVALEWVRSLAVTRGLVGTEFSVAASSILHILALGGLIIWTARGISQFEARLAKSEAEQRRLAEINARLIEELNHRVRNNLASLRSLIAINRKRATGLDQFATYVDRGVTSMAGVYSMLIDRANGSLNLRRMLDETFKQLRSTYGRPDIAVELAGPEVELGVRQVMPLSLTISELYANCVRHGAGTGLEGRLCVEWTVDRDDTGREMLRLEWIESGGPTLEGLVVPGTGMELVRGFVDYELGGSCVLRFPPAGVHHTIVLPVIKSDSGIRPLQLNAG